MRSPCCQADVKLKYSKKPKYNMPFSTYFICKNCQGEIEEIGQVRLKMTDSLERLINKIEKCTYHESDFNENGIIYACELDNRICRLINEGDCKNYEEEKSWQVNE